jgi:exodeoxyribonuclease VII large subunit
MKMADLFDLPFEEDEEPPATKAGDGGAPPVRRVLSVTELNVRLRDAIESQFFEIWVEGELSNCKVWNNGHLYFTLKDQASQIKGFMFRSSLRYLKFKPADGLKVVARGKISVYEPRGEYQLVCEHLEPQGLGALQLAFDQLKKRLQAEGLFDAATKRLLPALPRKIGVVTSLEGAAIRDILKVLRRRHANVQVVIRPARVQGEGAALEIARGLRAVVRVPGVDVVIVGRGGGSIEDLWAFNEEVVARTIKASPVPVISAVGHESDVTIADFVADLRAPTPSAAAEMVVAAKDEFRSRIDRLRDRMRAAERARIQALSRRVHVLGGRPALSGIPGRVAMRGRQAAELSHELTRAMRARLAARERLVGQLRQKLDASDLGRRLAVIRTRLVGAEGRLGGAVARRRHAADRRLRECAGRLDTLSPLAVLGRGYSVCWTADRSRAIRDAEETNVGDRVRVTLARGELDCEVRDKAPAAGAVTDSGGKTGEPG